MMTVNVNCRMRKPRRKSGLLRSGRIWRAAGTILVRVFSIILVVSVFLNGCAPVAPRFRTGESTSGAVPRQLPAGKPAVDSASIGGDDIETSSREAAEVVTGTRSFKTEKNSAISNLDQAKMMREISKMMGVSYKLGGMGDEGIDCSAYTMNVYRNALGRQLPRTSVEQSRIGSRVENEDLKFGDLVFFNTTGEPGSHVGIYLGDDLFAHASVSLGVTISSLESYYYKKRYEGARRVVE